ncbi:MAG: class I SAM-dependent methyltransferase, partial [Cellulomonadaceae bacterium]
ARLLGLPPDAVRIVPELGPDAVAGARVVLLYLPRSLEALAELADTVAAHADPGVVVYAGGRLKHMTRAMNDVLGGRFADVHATLARGKSRVLVAAGARPEAAARPGASPGTPSGTVLAGPALAGPARAPGGPGFPRREWHQDLDLTVAAHGAAFAGTRVDIGTRFLLGFLDQVGPERGTALDLGCGTGVLAVALARARPGLHVVATDRSAAAVASARATAAANGVADRVTVLRDDAAGSVPDGSVDVVLCNPPFHLDAAVHTGAASRMFAAAARVLRPGGELWTVYNSALRYKGELGRTVGPTELVGQNPKFTVTQSVRR